MKNIIIKSTLHEKYLDELNNLLFFNPGQRKIAQGILASIEKYGVPSVKNDHGLLKITVGALHGVQSLFAFEELADTKEKLLAGVAIFFREDTENIALLHIAVHEQYALSSGNNKSYAALRLLEQLMESAAKIKGVNFINIYYSKTNCRKIKLKRKIK